MSDIKFTCPRCGKSIAVDEKHAGLAIACPECQEKIVCKRIITPKKTNSKASLPKIIMTPLLKGCFVAIVILLFWASAASLVASSRGTEIVQLSTELAAVKSQVGRLRKETVSLNEELAKSRQDYTSLYKEDSIVNNQNEDSITKTKQGDASIEQEFCKMVLDAAKSYKSASNELQCSMIRSERKGKLKSFASKYGDRVEGWTGTIKKMTTTGSGDAILYVALTEFGKEIELKTWNNSLLDIGDETIIKQSSPMFYVLSSLPEGTPIKFSGKLFFDERDGFRELSMTEMGSMNDPEFLFRFTSIQKL